MPDVNARTYASSVRTEGARRTRRAIADAAAALFVDHGYGATSVASIAALAGVARPTVTASFGSKAAVLRQVVDEALAGDDEPVPVAQRPWFLPVLRAGSPQEVVQAYSGVCALIGERAYALFEVVHRAAGEGGEVARLWATLCENRRRGAAMVARRVVEVDPGRTPPEVEQLTDVLWILNDPAQYAALVVQRGWDVAAYRRWFAASASAWQHLPPRSAQPSRPDHDRTAGTAGA